MAIKFKLKRGTSTPTTSDLDNGEVGVDTSAKILYINDSGTVKALGSDLGNVGQAILPSATQTYNLGSGTKKWNQIFAETLFVGATVNATGGMFSSDIHASQGKFSAEVTCDDVLPNSNNSFKIGTSTNKWSEVHATSYYGDGSNLTGVAPTGSITPSASLQFDIGTSNLKYAHIFTDKISNNRIQGYNSQNIYFNNSHNSQDIRIVPGSAGATYIDSSLLPYANNSKDLGSSTYKWKDLYLSDIYLDNRIRSTSGNVGKITFTGGANSSIIAVETSAQNQIGQLYFNAQHTFGVMDSSGAYKFKIDGNGAVDIYDTLAPNVNNTTKLGTSSKKWEEVHATTYYGDGSNLTGISTDLVNDTTPSLGGNLDVNSKIIEFGDSSGATDDRLKFGAHDDLQIYHDGSHSYIKEDGTGQLRIQSSQIAFQNADGTVALANFTDGVSCQLLHGGTRILETESTGILVDTDSSVTRVRLQSGANTIGSLRFHNNDLMLETPSGGSSQLTYGGSTKLATTNTGVTVTGTVTATSFSGDGSNLTGIATGITSDAAGNTVGGTNAGDAIVSGGNENTLFGSNAGTDITTGDANIAFGYYAGASITTQTDGIFIGHHAGSNATANQLLAIGTNALRNATGGSNVGIGYGAGDAITSATENILIGVTAGGALTTGSANVAVGHNALDACTTANFCVAIGKDSLGYSTAGNNNTGVGYQALFFTNGGNSNTALGAGAIRNQTTGSGNTGLGQAALYTSTTGQGNTAVGDEAMRGQTVTGYDNVGIGQQAVYNLTTGYENAFIGTEAGKSVNTGYRNVGIGYQSLYQDTSGRENVAIGYRSLFSCSNHVNVAVGEHALYSTTSSGNVGIGSEAGKNNAGGYGLTAVGLRAGMDSTGNFNTFLGRDAGNTGTNDVTSGANNTLIGANAQASSATVSNEITLGDSQITKFRIPGIDFILKDNGGTPTQGHVLTVDANGEASFAAGAGGVSSDSQYNTVAGTDAGNSFSGTSAEKNTLFGYQAGKAITTGDANTLIGYQAGEDITTGGGNTIIGEYSGERVTTQYGNTFLGQWAASENIGSSNVALGTYTMKDSGTGSNCVAVGASAMYNNHNGNNNIGIGATALYGLWGQPKDYNIGIGTESLRNSTGDYNIAIGRNAGKASTSTPISGEYNILIGNYSGNLISTGSNNTLLGEYAGATLTTGSNNLILGHEAEPTAATTSNEVTVGNTSISKFRIPGINFELDSGVVSVKNGGTRSEVRWYCESNNAHYAAIKAPAHSDFSGNLTFVLPPNYGSNGQVLQSDGSGGTSWTTPSSGGASVGGANTQVQFNSNGALAGSSNLTFNGTDLAVGGTVSASSSASGTPGLRKITASTAAPSGGSDGDVWIKYT